MRRALGWLNSLWWHVDSDEESDLNDNNIDGAVVQTLPAPVAKRDLIDPLEHPIELPLNFDPETVAGWNFMVRTLSRQGWLTYQSMLLGGFQTNVNDRVITEPVLKLLSIALGDDKRKQEEINHAVLHDIRRPVINGQFYPEVYRIFAVYMRPIYCRRSLITFLCIRAYCADETLLYTGGDQLRSFKWLPKEIVALIAKYLWATKRERCWDKK